MPGYRDADLSYYLATKEGIPNTQGDPWPRTPREEHEAWLDWTDLWLLARQ